MRISSQSDKKCGTRVRVIGGTGSESHASCGNGTCVITTMSDSRCSFVVAMQGRNCFCLHALPQALLPQMPGIDAASVHSAQRGVFVNVLAPGVVGNMMQACGHAALCPSMRYKVSRHNIVQNSSLLLLKSVCMAEQWGPGLHRAASPSRDVTHPSCSSSYRPSVNT
jgi:hypothetical protein